MTVEQVTRHIFMVEPETFYCNPETIATNPYQDENDQDREGILKKAIQEFRAFHTLLIEKGVHVSVAKGSDQCPDHIFPNWFSTHEGGKAFIYPMLSENRSAEKTPEMLETIALHYDIFQDWSFYEEEQICLEGLSAIILDRRGKKAYGTNSARMEPELAEKWCQDMGYDLMLFETQSHTGDPIYHSDVMMHIGRTVVGICAECILPEYRGKVMDRLRSTHDVIELSADQIQNFAGNALEVRGFGKETHVVVSKSGYDSLNEDQKSRYRKHVNGFITPDLSTIQQYGGGAARCMIQELF